MADQLPWFRWYTRMTRDRILRRMPVEHRWLWVAISTAASDSPTRGTLLLDGGIPIDAADLADEASLPVPSVESGVAAFTAAGWLTTDPSGAWVVTGWSDSQFESDSSTSRTRRFRERQREQGGNVPVTPPESDPDPDPESSSSSDLPVEVEAAVTEVARLRMEAEQARGVVISSPSGWLRVTAANCASDGTLPKVTAALARYDEPARNIAEHVEGRRPATSMRRRQASEAAG